MRDGEQKIIEAKAWCFDNGITAEKMQSAWEHAKETYKDAEGMRVLMKYNKTWQTIAPHLLKKMIERFLVTEVSK